MTIKRFFSCFYNASPTHFSWITSYIAETDTIVAHSAKRFLVKREATFLNEPTNFPNKAPRNSSLFFDFF